MLLYLSTARNLLAISLVLLFSQAPSSAATLDFEGFPDGTQLTTQYSGVTFTNATVITAGISLNEFEFPPRSGESVIFDDDGSISITFATPIFALSGFLTYSETVELVAFDRNNVPIGFATTRFLSNLMLSGDAGSSSNERLGIYSQDGIAQVSLAGNPSGSSFTLDDLSTTASPEPASFLLIVTGLGCLGLKFFFSRSQTPKDSL